MTQSPSWFYYKVGTMVPATPILQGGYLKVL